MTDDTPIRLPFEPGDICIQAHANGAILLVDHGYRSRFVPLAEAVHEAEAARDRANQVFLAWEDDSPIPTHVVDAVRATDVRTADYASLLPPYSWPDGGSALITAAAHRQDAILEDLIDRGVDLDHRDDQRATALHHAANVGNVHAVERLVAAGADRTLLDGAGRTPLALATLLGHVEVVAVLAPTTDRGTADADPDTPAAERGPTLTVRRHPLHTVVAVLVMGVSLAAFVGIAAWFAWWAAPLGLALWIAVAWQMVVLLLSRFEIGPDRIAQRVLGWTWADIPIRSIGSVSASSWPPEVGPRHLIIKGRDTGSRPVQIHLEASYRPRRAEWMPDLIRRLRAAGHHIDADHPSRAVIDRLLRDGSR